MLIVMAYNEYCNKEKREDVVHRAHLYCHPMLSRKDQVWQILCSADFIGSGLWQTTYHVRSSIDAGGEASKGNSFTVEWKLIKVDDHLYSVFLSSTPEGAVIV